jgi:hypothetical protein
MRSNGTGFQHAPFLHLAVHLGKEHPVYAAPILFCAALSVRMYVDQSGIV